ncbi:MAG: TIGR02680 family protein [Myxococcaceae bacterium]
MTLAAAEAPEPTPLPLPTRPRWQPLRSGLLNLYRYDHEEFWFEDGHLLLRGNNGTGKSRVLALQLPFLLDGEVSPSRFEPDGDPAKRMEWNLLMGRHEDRSGYTWLELGRRTEEGAAEFVTIGCGLSATQGQTGVHRWFFLTAQRVGETLFLQGPAGQPLTRERLKESLGAAGEVFTTAQAYRAAVDGKLFKLGPHRYEALVGLLIQLRKPQLSRSLDQHHLASALSEALPPLPQKVVDDIAEAFRALERERSELESFRTAAAAVERFLESYRRYVQVAVRQRCEGVRSSHTDYENAQRAQRKAEQRLAEAEAALLQTGEQLRAQEVVEKSAAAEAGALEDSEEYREARTLAQRQQQAASAAREASSAQEALGRAGTSLSQQKRALAQSSEAAGERVEAAKRLTGKTRQAAEDAGFEARWPELEHSLLSALREPGAPPGPDLSERLVSDRHRAIDALKRLGGVVAAARAVLGSAAAEHSARAGELEEALIAEAEDRQGFEAAREALLGALERWHESLTVLDAGPLPGLLEELSAWCEDRTPDFPLDGRVGDSLGAVLEQTAGQRASCALRLAGVERAIADAEDRRCRLAEGQHVPPAAPHTRGAGARAQGTKGAPLWRLCNFHPKLSAERRAGLEAALEASCLLDAWVTPEGQLLPEGTFDVALRPGQPLDDGAARLSDWLTPAVDAADALACGVSEATVQALLDSIGGGEGVSEHWVDPRGSFRLGPLSGAWAKAAAEHLGHAAREEARRAGLARVEAELEALAEERRGLEAERQRLDETRQRAQAEAKGAPRGDEVLRAGAKLEASGGLVRTRRARVAEAEAKLAAAREEVARAQRALEGAAKDLGLETWTGKLEELERRTLDYQQASHELRRASERAGEALRERARCERDVRKAEELEADARGQAERASEAAAVAGALYDALAQAVGATAEQVSKKLALAKERARAAQGEVLRLTGKRGELLGARDAAGAAIDAAAGGLERATLARGSAIALLAQLGEVGFLGLVEPGLAQEKPASWAPTRALEVARQLEAALVAVDHSPEAWSRLGNQMQLRFQNLQTELGASGLFHPEAGMPHGVFHVRVGFQSRLLEMDELRAVVGGEVLQRQTLLDQRERELLENHLLGEVASHLHELLHDAERWVRAMNGELEKTPTSTGMALNFHWEPRAEGPAGLGEARRLLLRNQATWSPEQRRAAGSFLKMQIDRARADFAEATWQEHLSRAFDYRAWHDFSIHRKQDGHWLKLTKRTHGTGSGGEKAIALTLPQFAAAAAHYQSAAPTAPRLILLDEVFVGIDADMRAKCMALLSTFDLDFVMTSEREWGCYATLPGVAIYQLTGRAGIDAVHVTRFVWNGRARVHSQVVLPSSREPGVEG